jgi:hypothetical protein
LSDRSESGPYLCGPYLGTTAGARVDCQRAATAATLCPETSSMKRSVVAVLSAVAFFAGASACSGPEAPSPAASPAAVTSAAAPAAQPAAKAAQTGDCDLVSQDEIEAAFGGALTVTRMSGRGARGSSCTISIAQGMETQLVIQAGNRAAFEARKEAYQSQSRIPMVPLEIGTEAYLVNGAQAIAVDDNDRSISVGLTLITVGAPTPITAEVAAAGVEEVTRKAFGRL